MGVNADFQIINYSTRRHLDIHTLSRIRSHAQRYVQGSRGRGKGACSFPARAKAPSAPNGSMTSLCSTIDFAACQKKPAKVKRVRRCSRRAKETQSPTEENEDLDPAPLLPLQGPGAAFEPFDAFPVILDRDFVFLFDVYHEAWKWNQTKEDLFSETVSNATLCHSWLAIMYVMTGRNKVKAIEHEIQTIDLVYAGLEKLPTLSTSHWESHAFSLTWAILRLAMIKANQGDLDEVRNHFNALASIAPSKQVIDNHKFGEQLQCTLAMCLLFNVAHTNRIDPILCRPHGFQTSSTLEQTQTRGFSLPPTSPLLQSPTASLIDEHVLESLKALTALCQTHPGNNHTETQTNDQAIGCMKICLRLADSPISDPSPSQWQDELQGCLSLSALVFIWCFGRRNEATPTAISRVRNEVRQKLTPELICRVVNEVGRSQPLIDLMLWMLIVCGSAAETYDDKLYYSGLIRVLSPEFVDQSFEELEDWGRLMPWIRGCSNSPVKEFWALTTCRPGTLSQYPRQKRRVQCLKEEYSDE